MIYLRRRMDVKAERVTAGKAVRHETDIDQPARSQSKHIGSTFNLSLINILNIIFCPGMRERGWEACY
jgi:hypothetical protein